MRSIDSRRRRAGSGHKATRPPEREFAGGLGVSRSTLREAIRALVAMSILVSRHGDGTYVSSLELCVRTSVPISRPPAYKIRKSPWAGQGSNLRPWD